MEEVPVCSFCFLCEVAGGGRRGWQEEDCSRVRREN